MSMVERTGRTAWSRRARAIAGCWIVIGIVSASAAGGCGDVNAALEQLSEARQLSADLRVQFTKAADAANRAVMADTDEASVAFAGEANTANQAVQRDVDALGPLLQRSRYADESALLQQFVSRFAEYSALDRRILDLAVENSNLKAQRLSFGPAEEAADAFRDALESVAPSVPASEAWHVKALVAAAVTAVREIQVLQGPHIADPDDTAMTQIEKSMATSEAAARSGLATLSSLVPPATRARLVVATAALNRFMDINAQVIAQSRRNTNVRSLALSLNQKRTLTLACEDSVRALQDALAKRRQATTLAK